VARRSVQRKRSFEDELEPVDFVDLFADLMEAE
jgi:hypothetical protein